MKFFVPSGSDDPAFVYAAIKEHLGRGLGAEFSDRKIRMLQWVHEGGKYDAEVGKEMSNRSALYAIARLLGDISAVRRGKFAQRLIRKAILRKTGAFVNRTFK